MFKMVKMLTFVVLISSTFAIPLQKSDDSVLSDMNMREMANIFMSAPINDNSDQSSNVSHTFVNLFIIGDSVHMEEDLNLGLNKDVDNVAQTVGGLKAGALGLATKGLLVAKNGVRVAGRLFLKPIAILTGLHLKMFGNGLALGGKLLKGTGAGIAKTGTVVKVAGLGSIGLGASAIGWGLDKSTIDSHFKESNQKFIESK